MLVLVFRTAIVHTSQLSIRQALSACLNFAFWACTPQARTPNLESLEHDNCRNNGREPALRQEPIFYGEDCLQRPLMVSDVHRQQEVVNINFPHIFPSHNDRVLLLGLLHMHTMALFLRSPAPRATLKPCMKINTMSCICGRYPPCALALCPCVRMSRRLQELECLWLQHKDWTRSAQSLFENGSDWTLYMRVTTSQLAYF